MATSNPNVSGTGGGSVAIRGFLVQTLVALLEVANPESTFAEITLEPAVGDDQFDFLWKDKDGSYATQVKSTVNSFTKTDVKKWANKLKKARTDEKCTLMLVGNIPPALVGLNAVGGVSIETKNLHLGDLVEQAAQRLAKLLESEQMPAGTALQREMVVHGLTSRLEHLATGSEPLSRKSFLGLLREWINSIPKGDTRVDLSQFEVQQYAPSELIGRKDETQLLDRTWSQVIREEKPRPHILTFVAVAGEGKTSLVAKWVAELAGQDWPGCDAAFAWSFYNQGTGEQQVASSDLFLKEAFNFFGDAADKAFAASSASAIKKGQRLAHIIGKRRSLLILDGLEPLQYPLLSPTPGKLKDQGIAAVLKGLAAKNRGLCLVTTRYSIPDLCTYWKKIATEKPLLRLSIGAGVDLLQNLGVRKESGSPSEFEKLVEDVKGHALTLNLFGTFLRDAHGGNIRKRDQVKLEKADTEEQGGHAFRVMDAYVKSFKSEGKKGKRALAVLRLLGLFDRPASADCLHALCQPPVIAGFTKPLVETDESERNIVIKRLENAKLLTAHRNASGGLISVDAHPLLREYFARDVRYTNPAAWQKAHITLYKHLQSTAPEHPDNIIAMDILYQAVVHGCLAGQFSNALHQVYLPRISRRNQFFSTYILAAYSSEIATLQHFFNVGWRIIDTIPVTDQSIVLTRTGYALRAAGRLCEAASVLRQAVLIQQQNKQFKEASISSGILSHALLNIGNLKEAKLSALQGVEFAKRSGDLLQQVTKYSILSQIYHYMGQNNRALLAYKCGTRMAKSFPSVRSDLEFPVLNCLATYNYSEFLMSEGKIRDLQTHLKLAENVLIQSQDHDNSLVKALIQLMYGRICLFQKQLKQAQLHLDAALDLIMVAGREDDRSRVFISRAELSEAKKDVRNWRSNLKEALESAKGCESAICELDCYISTTRLHVYRRAMAKAKRSLDCATRLCRFGLTGYRRKDADIARLSEAIDNVAVTKANV